MQSQDAQSQFSFADDLLSEEFRELKYSSGETPLRTDYSTE